MKKTVATFCLLGATFALSACNTTKGNVDVEPPYTMERTASYQDGVVSTAPAATPTYVAPAERVFRRAQTK